MPNDSLDASYECSHAPVFHLRVVVLLLWAWLGQGVVLVASRNRQIERGACILVLKELPFKSNLTDEELINDNKQYVNGS